MVVLGGKLRMRHCLSAPSAFEGSKLLRSAERSIRVTSLTSSKPVLVRAESETRTDRAVLVLEGIARTYGTRTVLEIPWWTIAPRAHSLILGPSGSGKSTLLHLVAGLLRPSRGRVLVAGQDLGALTPAELDAFRGKNIGIVLQRLHLIGALTVRDNLRLAQSLAGLAVSTERVDHLLADLGIAALASARPHRLSEGEAQRTAIARAVINHPALILADEPTSALDDATCEVVLRLLRGQAEASGATLLIATHDARVKAHFAHRLELPVRP
jgi:putative ABC transport system ATP-binding protein